MFQKSGRTAAAFAKLWGCSPSSLTKWLARYEKDGPPHPSRLPQPVRDAVEDTRREHPGFGLRRIAAFLRRFRGLQVSPSTVGNVLRERGVPAQPRSRRKPRPKRKPPRRFDRAKPGKVYSGPKTPSVTSSNSPEQWLGMALLGHAKPLRNEGLQRWGHGWAS